MSFTVDFPEIEDCRKIYEMNHQMFGGELTIPPEFVEGWYRVNRYQWLVAKDEEGNLLGYINMSHIKDETFDDIINGKILERDVRSENIIELGKKGKICCYIQGFVVRDKNTRVAIALLNKVLGYVRFLKGNGVCIEKVGAMAVTGDGSRLCEKLGFKVVREIQLDNGLKEIIYVLNFNDKSYSKLVKSIKDIFLDTKEYI